MSPRPSSGHFGEGFETNQDSVYRSLQRSSRGGDKLLSCQIFIPALRVLSDWKSPSISLTPALESDKPGVTATEFHSNALKATKFTILNATTVATSQVVCTWGNRWV